MIEIIVLAVCIVLSGVFYNEAKDFMDKLIK